MTQAASFQERLAALLAEAAGLDDRGSPEQVEEVATRLEGLNFAPPVVLDAATFLRLRQPRLIGEIERIARLPESRICVLGGDQRLSCDDQRLQHLTVLLFYFKKLLALRRGDPGEWDEIDELYVHD